MKAPILSYVALIALLGCWRYTATRPNLPAKAPDRSPQSQIAPNAALAPPARQHGAAASPVPSLGRGFPAQGLRVSF